MKVVTSVKFERPTFENGYVKLIPIRGGTPEFTTTCKWVDRLHNEVWICNGATEQMELTRESVQKS